MSGTRETETTSEMQNGETFNDEMKDYAKSTMNELLGMFGYEEEITREAVEELQIRLLPEEDEEHMQQGNDEPSTCKPTPADGNTPMAVDKHADKPPVVVQVEGCDSGSSTSSLPVSNGKGVVETCTPPLVAVPMPSAPQLAVAVEGVTTDPPSSTNKPATALAPHFLVNPPNIHGVYCVVANLPVVNSNVKTIMTFKFWNCIMCSEYFVQKPEVVFRVEHPHLFESQPVWLYQAAVCQKCHRSLKSAQQGTSASVCRTDSSVSSTVVVAVPKQENGDALTVTATSVTETVVSGHETSDNLNESDKLAKELSQPAKELSQPAKESSQPAGESSHLAGELSQPAGESSKPAMELSQLNDTTERKGLEEAHEHLFECFVCSKPVQKSSRQGRLRRSKFPTLFNSFPEDVGIARVCFICCERLTRQRDRFVRAGISEEDRDYVAHIKIWTGQDVSSRFASPPAPKPSSDSTCFICEKFIPETSNQRMKTLCRDKYPSLFSVVPDQVVKLLSCEVCSRKLQKVKNRFDGSDTKEEERDFWEYINSWRDKKGLEKHMYSR